MAKRKLNVELKLTPLIDLFTVLVVMLLNTAVWTQMDSFATNTQNTTASATPSPPSDPKKKEVTLAVTVYPHKVDLIENDKLVTVSNLRGEIRPEPIVKTLNRWRQTYPDKRDVILNSDNQVAYKLLIDTFDLLVGNDFPDVGVSTQ